MTDRPVLFIDSGVGGLPYFAWVAKQRPEGAYLYFADREFFPYGEKSGEAIRRRLEGLMSNLIERYHPVLTVIACNTASTAALSYLRQRFSLPLVGVVPAIKPAALASPGKSIGIMATEGTVNGDYLDRLEQEFASGCQVLRYAAPDIVDFVENRLYQASPEEERRILEGVAEYFDNRVDTIVLGCTHFLHIKETLEKNMGHRFTLVDSVEGVGRQILRQLPPGSGAGRLRDFIHTGRPENPSYREMARRFGLKYRGGLPW